jgi:hypothetical protein
MLPKEKLNFQAVLDCGDEVSREGNNPRGVLEDRIRGISTSYYLRSFRALHHADVSPNSPMFLNCRYRI